MSSSKTFSFKKNNKKAFTLIELSIVLIIIGLLIVAITSGSSLIRNAKLRSITNESKQYQVAVNSFFMKFDEYPGDFDKVIGSGNLASVAGDNNDIIEWERAQTTTGSEGGNAWLHLINSDILPDDVITSLDTLAERNLMIDATGASVTLSPGTHFPSSAESASGWVFGSDGTTNYVYITKAIANAFNGTTVPVNTPTVTGVLTTADAYSIDNKSDDSIRTAGDIREVITTDTNCQDAIDANQYDLTYTGESACSLAFKVTIN